MLVHMLVSGRRHRELSSYAAVEPAIEAQRWFGNETDVGSDVEMFPPLTVSGDHFFVIWDGLWHFDDTGHYRFTWLIDADFQLIVDGVVLLQDWLHTDEHEPGVESFSKRFEMCDYFLLPTPIWRTLTLLVKNLCFVVPVLMCGIVIRLDHLR